MKTITIAPTTAKVAPICKGVIDRPRLDLGRALISAEALLSVCIDVSKLTVLAITVVRKFFFCASQHDVAC